MHVKHLSLYHHVFIIYFRFTIKLSILNLASWASCNNNRIRDFVQWSNSQISLGKEGTCGVQICKSWDLILILKMS